MDIEVINRRVFILFPVKLHYIAHRTSHIWVLSSYVWLVALVLTDLTQCLVSSRDQGSSLVKGPDMKHH